MNAVVNAFKQLHEALNLKEQIRRQPGANPDMVREIDTLVRNRKLLFEFELDMYMKTLENGQI